MIIHKGAVTTIKEAEINIQIIGLIINKDILIEITATITTTGGKIEILLLGEIREDKLIIKIQEETIMIMFAIAKQQAEQVYY